MDLFLRYSFRKVKQHFLLLLSVILLVFLSALSISLLISNQQQIESNYNLYRNSDKSGPGYTGWINFGTGVSLTDSGSNDLINLFYKWSQSSGCASNSKNPNENNKCVIVQYRKSVAPIYPNPNPYKFGTLDDFNKKATASQKSHFLKKRDSANITSDAFQWTSEEYSANINGPTPAQTKYDFKISNFHNSAFAQYGGSNNNILFSNIINSAIEKNKLNIKYSFREEYRAQISSPEKGTLFVIPIINSQNSKFSFYQQNTDKFVLTQGKLPSSPDEVAVTWRKFNHDKLHLGQTITMKCDGNVFPCDHPTDTKKLKLVGIGNTDWNMVNSNSDHFKVFMDADGFYNPKKSLFNDAALTFAKSEITKSRLFLNASKPETSKLISGISTRIEADFNELSNVAANYNVFSSTYPYYFKMTLTGFSYLSIWLSVLIIIIDSIVILAVLQTLFRRWKYDLGMLKALGYNRKKLLLLLLTGPILLATLAFIGGFWANLILQYYLFSHIWDSIVTFYIPSIYISWPTFAIVGIAAPIILLIISIGYALFSFRASALKLIFGDRSIHANNGLASKIYSAFLTTIKYVFLYPIRGPMAKFRLSFYLTQIWRSLLAMGILTITAALFTFPLLIVTVANNTNSYENTLLKYSLDKLNIATLNQSFLKQVAKTSPNNFHSWIDVTNQSTKKYLVSINIDQFASIINNAKTNNSDDDVNKTIYQNLAKNNYYLDAHTIAKIYTGASSPNKELVKQYLISSGIANNYNIQTPRNIAFGSQPYNSSQLSPTVIDPDLQKVQNIKSPSNNFKSQILQLGDHYDSYFNLDLNSNEKSKFNGDPWKNSEKHSTIPFALYAAVSDTLTRQYGMKLNTSSPQFELMINVDFAGQQLSNIPVPIIPIATVPRALNSARVFLYGPQVTKYITDMHFPAVDADSIGGGLTIFNKVDQLTTDYIGIYYDNQTQDYHPILQAIGSIKKDLNIKTISINFPGFNETALVLSIIIIVITFVIVISFVATIMSDNQRIITILKITGYRISEIVSIVVTYYAVGLLIALGAGVAVAYALLNYFSHILLKLAGYEFYTGLVASTLGIILAILFALFLGVISIGFVLAHKVTLVLPYSE